MFHRLRATITLTLIALCTFLLSCVRVDQAQPELRAIYNLRNVSDGEKRARSTFGRYMTLRELAGKFPSLIEPATSFEDWDGYRFDLRLDGFLYSIQAVPLSNTLARRSFYIDQSGVLRQSWLPEIADAGSSPVK